MKGGKPITLSYLLAFVNLLIIKCSDTSLYNRLNLISTNLKLIRAILRPDMYTNKELKENLDNLSIRINALREKYKTSLEVNYIYAPYNQEFRAEYEIKIYDFLEDLYFYIEEYQMINERTYGEVEAKSWTLDK